MYAICDSINLKIYEHEWRCKREYFLFRKTFESIIVSHLYRPHWLTFIWLRPFYIYIFKKKSFFWSNYDVMSSHCSFYISVHARRMERTKSELWTITFWKLVSRDFSQRPCIWKTNNNCRYFTHFVMEFVVDWGCRFLLELTWKWTVQWTLTHFGDHFWGRSVGSQWFHKINFAAFFRHITVADLMFVMLTYKCFMYFL